MAKELCSCVWANRRLSTTWGVGVPLQLDDDAHTVAVCLILNVADALQTLILHLVGHILDKHPLVHLIRKLRDDDAGAVVAEFLEFVAGPNHYPARPVA